LVTAKHVVNAKRIARSLEQQVADRMIERGKEYQTFITEGAIVGMVNGLAVLVGDNSIAEFSGIVLPIAAEVTPAQAKQGGRIIATGRLGDRPSDSGDSPREHEGCPPGGSLPGENRDHPGGHAERGPRGGARGSEEVRAHQQTRGAGPEDHAGQAGPGRGAPLKFRRDRWTIRWIPPSSPNRCPATISASLSPHPRMPT